MLREESPPAECLVDLSSDGQQTVRAREAPTTIQTEVDLNECFYDAIAQTENAETVTIKVSAKTGRLIKVTVESRRPEVSHLGPSVDFAREKILEAYQSVFGNIYRPFHTPESDA